MQKLYLPIFAILLLCPIVLALTSPPTWSDLVTNISPSEPPPLCVDVTRQPLEEDFSLDRSTVPILFRERHGWCVFSTRVWLALECKGIHYHTYLVESQGDTYDGADAEEENTLSRPEFLEGLTLPQLKLPGMDALQGADTEEDLLNVLSLLDQTFSKDDNNSTILFPSDEVWKLARAFQGCLPSEARVSRRAAWLFCAEEGYRLDALSRGVFEDVLDQAEELLQSSNGPFFCGTDLTAADIVWTPLLERYAAQLPCLHRGLRARNKQWPHLYKWYQAMDAVPAYVCRIQGDALSWLKVLYSDPWWPRADLWHPRDTVGPKGELQATEPECIEAFTAGDNNFEEDAIWSQYASTRPYVAQESPAHEAANTITRNRKAILKDAAQWLYEEGYDAMTGQDLDAALRQIVVLLSSSAPELKEDAQNIVVLLTYLDARICVPRDMGNLPASSIRRLLRKEGNG